MPEPNRDEERPARETAAPIATPGRPDEPMDEEEKVLAGRLDANMPALLTRDVPGG
jgi:hypothetical protein